MASSAFDNMAHQAAWQSKQGVGEASFTHDVPWDVFNRLQPAFAAHGLHAAPESVKALLAFAPKNRNQNYFLVPDNEGGKIIHMRANIGEDPVVFVADLLKQPAYADLSCVTYLPYQDQKYITQLDANAMAMVTDYVAGEKPLPGKHDLKNLGRQLAKLEQAHKSLPQAVKDDLIQKGKDTLESFAQSVEFAIQNIQHYAQVVGQENAQTLVQLNTEFPDIFTNPDKLGIYHGDAHEGNLIVMPSGELHFLDFEAMAVGGHRPEGFDFGQAAYRTVLGGADFLTADNESVDYAKLKTEKTTLKAQLYEFAEGYAKEREIDVEKAMGYIKRAAAAKALQIVRNFKIAVEYKKSPDSVVAGINKQANFYRAVDFILS